MRYALTDAKEELSRSRGRLTTRIHAVVDGNGWPLKRALAAGHEHDSVCAIVKPATIRSWLSACESRA